MLTLLQSPSPSSTLVKYCGDRLFVHLKLSSSLPGQAFLRTNLGHAALQRQELLDTVERGLLPNGRAWHDMEMSRTGEAEFSLCLPLHEVGLFEFKAYFIAESTGKAVWCQGTNATVKVEPAATVSDNTIYNAFVRQFGANLSSVQQTAGEAEAVQLLDRKNYTVIPPSGTFRNLQGHLSEIIDELGFRFIQLLPIHPEPSTYARMGRFGSPFAALDFFSVSPQLADFDSIHTPLEQFQALADAIHGKGGGVLLDLPANHTGWNAIFQQKHPEWYVRNSDGSFHSPGAWGVTWADLCQLDYGQHGLWHAMANVFRYWCRHGVDGFRCDAGYMIPAAVWRYIIAKVRKEYPDCIFFLEGLGGSMQITEELLARSGFNWAYSEIFEKNDSASLNRLNEYSSAGSRNLGTFVNFSETHDNNRLAARSPLWSSLRCAMAALFAPAGAFGIANGVEWLATEKIDVHGSPSLNWGAAKNIRPLLRKLLCILKNHPAFTSKASLRIPVDASGDAVGLLRTTRNPEETVLVVANPSDTHDAVYEWNFKDFNPDAAAFDLLSERTIACSQSQCLVRLLLRPGQVVCLALSASSCSKSVPHLLDANRMQRLRAAVLGVQVACFGYSDISGLALDELALVLFKSPVQFLRKLFPAPAWLPYIEWHPECDAKRQVVVPLDHFVLIRASSPFTAEIFTEDVCDCCRHSLVQEDGTHFCLLAPKRAADVKMHHSSTINVRIFNGDSTTALTGSLLYQGPVGTQRFALALSTQGTTCSHQALATTDLGGYAMVRALWERLDSQYDALLAANLNSQYPVDRTVILRRFRTFVFHNGFSHKLGPEFQTQFAVTSPSSFRWNFTVQTGLGQNIYLQADVRLSRSGNAVALSYTRLPGGKGAANSLADTSLNLVLRPDLEWRSCHETTRCTHDLEDKFGRAVSPAANGFTFSPYGQALLLQTADGTFAANPEWLHGHHHPCEAERGLPAETDMFSPGTFNFKLKENATVTILAAIQPDSSIQSSFLDQAAAEAKACASKPLTALPFIDHVRNSVRTFIARREDTGTVIAGFPWFLDWGRDTLICLRGLIADGLFDLAEGIIRKFASFEENGTIPNMIHGQDTANRETSDAPLWLIIAARDFLQASGRQDFLSTDCRGRTLMDILLSIVRNYQKGTANGIRVCPDTALVYSPAHFTWMDTNYPAGTPRQGYPVEIQVLWIASLDFLSDKTGDNALAKLAEKARRNFLSLFKCQDSIGLPDCLHTAGFVSALQAVPDDHCRPNQLLAVTLGTLSDFTVCDKIVRAALQLLVPGAIRSLADSPVTYLLPVTRHGQNLNDPAAPYWGHYCGDEDTRRKPAYHNGTAWGWLMPSLAEAMLLTYGSSAKDAASSFVATCSSTLFDACMGHCPEIEDGDIPHTPRGCLAQAWSATEVLRLLRMLEKD